MDNNFLALLKQNVDRDILNFQDGYFTEKIINDTVKQ